MKIEYRFVNREKASIDVSGDFEKIILELDRNLYNNNHTETRRHISLDNFNQNKNVFADIEVGFEKRISNQVDKELLHKAISMLKPDKKSPIYRLCLSDKPMTQKQYADVLGITENAVQLRLAKIKKKLRRIISSNS